MFTASSASPEPRGSITVIAAVFLVLVAVLAVAVSILADAMIHRVRAHNAADAIALAAAVDADAGADLAQRYRRDGIAVDQHEPFVITRSGPSRAHALAQVAPAPDQPAPVMVAIVERAGQLTGEAFTALRWDTFAVALPARDAPRLRLVAADLGLCEVPGAADDGGWIEFARC